MKKYNLCSERLAEGQKVTLVWQGEFGGVVAIPTTYIGCRPAPHYHNCPDSMVGVTILHKPMGKRKAAGKTIGYNVPLVVYDGWQGLDVDGLVFKPINDHLRESRYAMHDDQYFRDLLAEKPDGVVFADIGGRADG